MPDTTVVYMVHAIGTTLVKIGVTENLTRRIRGLQTLSPLPLQLVCCFPQYPGHGNLERLLHRAYAKYRQQGEWFDIPFAQDYPRLMRHAQQRIADALAKAMPMQTSHYEETHVDPSAHTLPDEPMQEIDALSERIKDVLHLFEADIILTSTILLRLDDPLLTNKMVRKACNILVRADVLERLRKNTYRRRKYSLGPPDVSLFQPKSWQA